jgi:hypothetical protein
MSSHFLEKPKISLCPGKYCGYQTNNTNCGVRYFIYCISLKIKLLNLKACQRGYRVNNESICQLCTEPLSLYNFMYIVFMSLLALSFHWYFINRLRKKKQRDLTLIKYVWPCF